MFDDSEVAMEEVMKLLDAVKRAAAEFEVGPCSGDEALEIMDELGRLQRALDAKIEELLARVDAA